MLNAYSIYKLHIDEAIPPAPDDPDPSSPEDVKNAAIRSVKEPMTFPGTGSHDLFSEFKTLLTRSPSANFARLGTSVGVVGMGSNNEYGTSDITLRIGVHDVLFVNRSNKVEVFVITDDISFYLRWINKFLPSGWQLITVNDDNCRWVNTKSNIGNPADPIRRIIPFSNGDFIDAKGYLHAHERPIYRV